MDTLLMRPRKASEHARRTQIQIPIKVKREFFQDVTTVTSLHDGDPKNIVLAHARGSLNTIKLEVPEIGDFEKPVIKFTRKDSLTCYQAHDAGEFFDELEQGIKTGKTFISTNRNVENATWWQYKNCNEHIVVPTPKPKRILDSNLLGIRQRVKIEKETLTREASSIVDGYVYVISHPSHPGLVKVGKARDYIQRFSSFQTHDPYSKFVLEYYHHYPVRKTAEKDVHILLDQYRIHPRKEWFRCPLDTAKNALDQVLRNIACDHSLRP